MSRSNETWNAISLFGAFRFSVGVKISIIVEVRTAKDYMGAFGSDGYLYDFAKERIPNNCFQFLVLFSLCRDLLRNTWDSSDQTDICTTSPRKHFADIETPRLTCLVFRDLPRSTWEEWEGTLTSTTS